MEAFKDKLIEWALMGMAWIVIMLLLYAVALAVMPEQYLNPEYAAWRESVMAHLPEPNRWWECETEGSR